MLREYNRFAQVSAAALTPKPGFWVVPMVSGVTCGTVISVCLKLGLKIFNPNVRRDVASLENDRDPNETGSYSVMFASDVEAGGGLDQHVFEESEGQGITVLERLVLGLGYFLTNSNLLDRKVATVCSGSRRPKHDTVSGCPVYVYSAGVDELCINAHGRALPYMACYAVRKVFSGVAVVL